MESTWGNCGGEAPSLLFLLKRVILCCPKLNVTSINTKSITSTFTLMNYIIIYCNFMFDEEKKFRYIYSCENYTEWCTFVRILIWIGFVVAAESSRYKRLTTSLLVENHKCLDDCAVCTGSTLFVHTIITKHGNQYWDKTSKNTRPIRHCTSYQENEKKKNINLLVLCAAATDTTAVGWIILDKYELHCGNNRQLCEAVRWCNIVVRAHTFRLYGIWLWEPTRKSLRHMHSHRRMRMALPYGRECRPTNAIQTKLHCIFFPQFIYPFLWPTQIARRERGGGIERYHAHKQLLLPSKKWILFFAHYTTHFIIMLWVFHLTQMRCSNNTNATTKFAALVDMQQYEKQLAKTLHCVCIVIANGLRILSVILHDIRNKYALIYMHLWRCCPSNGSILLSGDE